MSVNKFKVGDIVKCVDNNGYEQYISVGKKYKVLSITTDGMIMIENDNNKETIYYSYRFELSNSDVSPQPHKFKEGDMVYLIGFGCLKPRKLLTTSDNYSLMKFKVEVTSNVFETFTEDGKFLTIDVTPSIVLATEENRKMLNKLLGVEYEPSKLTGSDLAKKMLKDKPQTCYVSDKSDEHAISNGSVFLIASFKNLAFITMKGYRHGYAVPCNQHGEVLEDE